jgi:hypothetical protein
MFARFAWMIKPRNYLLCSCHVTNIFFQSKLILKKQIWLREQKLLKGNIKLAA